MSALYDVIGELAVREEWLSAMENYSAHRESVASELLKSVTQPAVEERVRAIEDRLMSAVFGPPQTLLQVDVDARDQQRKDLVGLGVVDRIRDDETRSSAIGKALIGEMTAGAWLPVAHEATLLRARGLWRMLPVGCLLLDSVRRPEIATVGLSMIEADMEEGDGFGSEPVERTRPIPVLPTEPVPTEVVA